MALRLRTLEQSATFSNIDESTPGENDGTSSLITVSQKGPYQSHLKVLNSWETPDLTQALQESWVYRRNDAFSHSRLSVATRSIYSTSWSTLSSLSMADISTISVLNLPITIAEITNPHRHPQSWSNEQSPHNWPLPSEENRLQAAHRTRHDAEDHQCCIWKTVEVSVDISETAATNFSFPHKLPPNTYTCQDCHKYTSNYITIPQGLFCQGCYAVLQARRQKPHRKNAPPFPKNVLPMEVRDRPLPPLPAQAIDRIAVEL